MDCSVWVWGENDISRKVSISFRAIAILSMPVFFFLSQTVESIFVFSFSVFNSVLFSISVRMKWRMVGSGCRQKQPNNNVFFFFFTSFFNQLFRLFSIFFTRSVQSQTSEAVQRLSWHEIESHHTESFRDNNHSPSHQINMVMLLVYTVNTIVISMSFRGNCEQRT